MTVIFREGCLLEAFKKNEVNVIIHCCNRQGVMGSGIAKSIKEKYPQVAAADEYWYSKKTANLNVENISLAQAELGWIFNLYGQEYYGRGPRQVDYGMFACGLFDVKEKLNSFFAYKEKVKVGLPYKIAADRAGGDLTVIHELICYILKDYEIIFYHKK